MYPGVSPDITHTHIYILICVLVHTTWTAFILNIFFISVGISSENMLTV